MLMHIALDAMTILLVQALLNIFIGIGLIAFTYWIREVLPRNPRIVCIFSQVVLVLIGLLCIFRGLYVWYVPKTLHEAGFAGTTLSLTINAVLMGCLIGIGIALLLNRREE